MDQLKTLNNGSKVRPTFSAEEMTRRLTALRRHMANDALDAVLFTPTTTSTITAIFCIAPSDGLTAWW